MWKIAMRLVVAVEVRPGAKRYRRPDIDESRYRLCSNDGATDLVEERAHLPHEGDSPPELGSGYPRPRYRRGWR